jgi:hypothetical protein
MDLLTDKEKKELFNKHLPKAKNKYPDKNEKSEVIKLAVEDFITDQILAENSIYQKRLQKAKEEAAKKAKKEFEQAKRMVYENAKSGTF